MGGEQAVHGVQGGGAQGRSCLLRVQKVRGQGAVALLPVCSVGEGWERKIEGEGGGGREERKVG